VCVVAGVVLGSCCVGRRVWLPLAKCVLEHIVVASLDGTDQLLAFSDSYGSLFECIVGVREWRFEDICHDIVR
jgi:hypothetical protein